MPARARSPLLATALLLAAVTSPAASIEDRVVDVVIEGASFVEDERLLIRLEEEGDLGAWAEFGIWVDQHIELVEASARVLDEAGREVEAIPRRRWREMTSTGGGLHSSARTFVVPFPRLKVGERLEIRSVRRHTPVFPTHAVRLQLGSPQDRLEVKVRGGGETLRWSRVGSPEPSLAVTESAEWIAVGGVKVPRRSPPDLAADDSVAAPALRFAWGEAASWPAVGAWYSDLVAGVERGRPEVGRLAAEIAAGVEDPWARLEVLSRWVKGTIRYEAVEIGIGGWVPTPAHEVLARGWGDCKDMSELLAELLRSVGLPAHLTLVNLGSEHHVDPDFPVALVFNHCVVAVPGEAVGAAEGPPAADGWVVIDPTMNRGGGTWLSPYIQGQWAVVAAGADSRLVQIPVLAEDEQRVLEVNGTLDGASGAFRGRAALKLTGRRALGWLRDQDAVEPARLEEHARGTLQLLLPGGRFEQVAWKVLEGDLPAVELSATADVPDLATGRAEQPRLRPTALTTLPESRQLEDRNEPVVLRPGIQRTTWRIAMPSPWCPVRSERSETANDLGFVRGDVSSAADGSVLIERTTFVRTGWVEPGGFDPLRELAAAERRLARRSVRLDCGPTDGTAE